VNRLQRGLHVILKWRKLMLLNTLVLTLVAVVISLVLPPRYTATAQLLPPPEDDVFGMSSVLGSVGGSFGRLQAGMLGTPTPSDMMIGIFKSRTIMEKVIERCSIIQRYRVKRSSMQRAVKILHGMTGLSAGDEGIVRIAVEAKTPQLAADVANCYLEELDDFLRHSNISRGRNVRVFVERRLGEVEDELVVAQESLEVFQQRHRTYAVDDETRAAIETYSGLMSHLYAKRAELAMQKAVSGRYNPHVARMNREIRALRSQLAKLEAGSGGGFGIGFGVPLESLPSVAAEYLRRYRGFRIQEEAYEMLSQQYEHARILEARDVPTLTVLDYAVPPERRSFPRRTLIVAAVFIFSLVMGVGFALVSEYFSHIRTARPEEYQGWREIGGQFAAIARHVGRLFLRKKK